MLVPESRSYEQMLSMSSRLFAPGCVLRTVRCECTSVLLLLE